jgi:hypothetical protein
MIANAATATSSVAEGNVGFQAATELTSTADFGANRSFTRRPT